MEGVGLELAEVWAKEKAAPLLCQGELGSLAVLLMRAVSRVHTSGMTLQKQI